VYDILIDMNDVRKITILI